MNNKITASIMDDGIGLTLEKLNVVNRQFASSVPLLGNRTGIVKWANGYSHLGGFGLPRWQEESRHMPDTRGF